MIPWHPHTETPALRVTAILAAPAGPQDDPWLEEALISGIYMYTADGWRSEVSGALVSLPEFWWCAEADLLAHLRPRICNRTNGHG
ncbi:MAG: hypothetical protein KJZ96_15495 [Rhodocyclaceae bacterium]|nr:hypothetical protein [Rhodocyclaceae bacterium]